jgi:hypothetical protein
VPVLPAGNASQNAMAVVQCVRAARKRTQNVYTNWVPTKSRPKQ